MIEWRWNLAPLTARDAAANNITHALDFTRPKDLTAPQFSVPTGPFGMTCTPAAASETRAEIEALRRMAERYRFPLPR